MKALLDLFKQVTQEEEFDAIKTGLASSIMYIGQSFTAQS